MDRLTGDFKGASMFATVEQARLYNRLRQYEDTNLTPDEIAALRAELDAAQRRAEAAEKDMKDAISMSPYAICGLFCKNHKPGCGRKNCRPEWRGSDAREGV